MHLGVARGVVGAGLRGGGHGGGDDLGLLASEQELAKLLLRFPERVAVAAERHAPHLVCDYLETTAALVNSWYHAGNPSRNPELAVLSPDPELRQARLVLARAVREGIVNPDRSIQIGIRTHYTHDDPIRVLYIEGVLRPEYTYLRHRLTSDR